MKQRLALFLSLVMLFQLLALPAAAAETTEAAAGTEETAVAAGETETAETEETVAEETEEITAAEADTDAETAEDAEAEDSQTEPEEDTSASEQAAAEEAEAASNQEEPAEPEESAEAEEETLYNGQEADYTDPQFLKLLADGFFEDDGIQVAASTTYSHSSAFDGYEVQSGVDISKWNEITSWSSLAQSVDFAIIRCGNRTTSGGSLSKDSDFDTNMTAALAAGLEVGVYIYSQAITEEEAREEAEFALELCEGYDFNLPIVIDYEYYGTDGRLYNANLTDAQRTSICRAFCEVIEAAGYPAMIYANKNMLVEDMQDAESLAEAGYEIWLANWVSSTSYSGTYTYWQYTDSGSVSGISGNVDMNFRYVLPEATLSGVSCTQDGVRLQWSSVSLADRYRVYRKLEGETAWTQIGTVDAASGTLYYLDETAEEGVTYRYAVQSCDGNVRALYDRTGTQVTYEICVALSDATVQSDGVHLTWTDMDKYDSYRILRRSSSGSTWTTVADITDITQTSYVDTQALTLATGTYYYTICGILDGAQAAFDTVGLAVTVRATPVLASATAQDGSILVKWSAVPDAEGYYIYRKTTGSWARIATVTGADTTSYQDSGATESGTVYTYTVVAYNAGGRSGYDSTGVSAMQLEVPALSSVTISDSGIQLTWQASANAEAYRVYRKTGSGSWALLGTATAASYLDQTAEYGVTYTYTVRSVCGKYWSGYDGTGLTVTRVATPSEITAVRSSESGATVSWEAVAGAASYRVYRKTGTGSWALLGTSTAASYTDSASLTAGTTYYYTVRAVDANGHAGRYLTAGKVYTHLETPTLQSAAAQSDGICVSWSAVSGATSYAVYRKVSGGSWSRVGTAADAASYTDTTAVSGIVYCYTVRAYGSNSYSWFDTQGISASYLAAPELKAVSVASGLTVSWASVEGASQYRVYRKSGSSGWSRVAQVTGTSYTDSSLVSGTVYYYTVRASNGSALSSYDTAGVSALYLEAPTPSTANTASGIRVTWNAVTGATGYVVYRKTSGGSWAKIGTASATGYTDTDDLTGGTTYYYTVRAVKDGRQGCYTSGSACIRLTAPVLTSVQNVETGLKVSWSAVTGAASYAVYRKTSGGSWAKVGTVTTTTYTDTTAAHDTTYYYTVRAISGSTLSSYDTAGRSCLRLDAPVLQSAVQTDSGVQVSWEAVSGVTSYVVYRKVSGGSWQRLATVSGTSYTDTDDLTDGTTYVYTVRAYKSNVQGGYSYSGISLTYQS